MEQFFHFDKYSGVKKYINDKEYKGMNLYFKPILKNQKAIDSIIYFQKANPKLAKYLKIVDINSKILVSFQIKKDVDDVFKILLDIRNKWKEEKVLIENQIPGVPHFLFLVTRLGDSNHRMEISIENNIYFLFTDVDIENTIFSKMK